MEHEFKNGDKVFLVHMPNVFFYYVGRAPNVFEKLAVVVNDSGQFYRFPMDSHLRLKEPVKVSGWVNVYDTHSEPMYCMKSFYRTKAEADNASTVKRIACVYVSGTEGIGP